MTDLALAIGFCLLASVLFMSSIFFIARQRRRYDLIDVAWGLSFISIAVVAFAGQPTYELVSVQTIAITLVIIWGLRLSIHIYYRWSRAPEEDKRYVTQRKQYAKKPGGVALNMYFRVYVTQAVLAIVISLPVIVLNTYGSTDITWVSLVGIVVWLVGFIFETVGDFQLSRFVTKSTSKDKLMTKGLWKYTRHPNYFGEVMQWWGVYLVALVPLYWWLGLLGPVTITILILFVSGVPLTEKHFAGRKGWDAYKKRTSIFLPLPPRKG